MDLYADLGEAMERRIQDIVWELNEEIFSRGLYLGLWYRRNCSFVLIIKGRWQQHEDNKKVCKTTSYEVWQGVTWNGHDVILLYRVDSTPNAQGLDRAMEFI